MPVPVTRAVGNRVMALQISGGWQPTLPAVVPYKKIGVLNLPTQVGPVNRLLDMRKHAFLRMSLVDEPIIAPGARCTLEFRLASTSPPREPVTIPKGTRVGVQHISQSPPLTPFEFVTDSDLTIRDGMSGTVNAVCTETDRPRLNQVVNTDPAKGEVYGSGRISVLIDPGPLVPILEASNTDIPQLAESSSSCLLQFKLSGPRRGDTTIPAGTRVGARDGGFQFVSQHNLTIPASQIEGSVEAKCAEVGSAANGLEKGRINTLLYIPGADPSTGQFVPNVLPKYTDLISVANTTMTTGGCGTLILVVQERIGLGHESVSEPYDPPWFRPEVNPRTAVCNLVSSYAAARCFHRRGYF
jgi:hypothetical protein